LEEAITAAETGDVRKLNSLYEEENYLPIFYPFHYIGSATLAEAIKRGHTAATKLYRAGKSRQGADRLALMFDLTVNLARTVSGDDFDSKGPDKWLQAWKSLEVPVADYIYALNDYGFFLQQAGEHAAAVPIFNLAIKESPERAVAHLNLADSLWALDRQAEAKSHYQTYQRLMTEENKGAQVPPRVAERSG
jgi:tetratricopeptide (TPR) repeat protein